MQGNSDGQINIFHLFQNFWDDRKLIGILTGLISTASIALAIWLPNIYEARVLLEPKNSEGELAGLARQYGGLASLAGISLPSAGEDSRTALAIEIIKSKSFAYEFSNKNSFLPALFAANGWNWETNSLELNPRIYNTQTKEWVRKVDPPRTQKPTPEEVHEMWNETVFVSEDKKTSFVTISIRHQSPEFAKTALELLVAEINETLRKKDLAASERAIVYLEEQVKQAQTAEIRDLLSGLLRSHMESEMMATIETDYVFSVIDTPTTPETKEAPQRVLIAIAGLLIGFITAVTISMIRKYVRQQKLEQLSENLG